jgi:hypothetical protein
MVLQAANPGIYPCSWAALRARSAEREKSGLVVLLEAQEPGVVLMGREGSVEERSLQAANSRGTHSWRLTNLINGA